MWLDVRRSITSNSCNNVIDESICPWPTNAGDWSDKALGKKVRSDDSLATWPRMRCPQCLGFYSQPTVPNPQGSSIHGARNAVIDDIDKNAVRVATLMRTTSMVKFYALVNQDTDGLCQAYKVDVEDVFYLKEYRDEFLTTVESRRNKWNGII